jgi:hypothetical protein
LAIRDFTYRLQVDIRDCDAADRAMVDIPMPGASVGATSTSINEPLRPRLIVFELDLIFGD